jgi:hypothetical protein
MVTCRNCHSALSDEAKICGVCGYQPDELPVAPLARGNVSYASPDYTGMPNKESEEGTPHSAGTILEWEDASPTEISLRPAYRDHRQPLSTHPQHHQPSQVHGEHRQPQPIHREHQQAQPIHGVHHQPQPIHGEHHQAQSIHGAHHQPRMPYAKHLKRGENAFPPSSLVIAISSLIIVSIVTISLFIVYMTNGKSNPNTTSVTNITLITSGKAVPGKTLQVIGNHFTPGQIVLVTLDDQPLAGSRTTADTWRSSTMSLANLSSAVVGGTPVTVQSNGTFTVEIHIDSHWTIGSTHRLSVYNQQGKELKSLTLTVEGDQPKPTPTAPTSTPTPASTPTPIPSASIPTPTPTTMPTPTPTPAQRLLTSQKTQSQTVKATGQETAPGTQATGSITIMNYDMRNPLDLSAGTPPLINTEGCTANGLQISLDSAVHLGPASPNGAPFPTTTVKIHVTQPGIAGNIQNCPSIEGIAYAFHYALRAATGAPTWEAYNTDSGFSGGTDPQQYTIVQQSDIDTAAAPLNASTQQSAVADINSQLRSNEHLVGNPQCTSNASSDHNAGDRANQVTVTVITTCTATAST